MKPMRGHFGEFLLLKKLISDDELRKIRTIQDSINFIKKKKGLLT